MRQPETYVQSRAISQSDLKLFRKDIVSFYNQVEMGERLQEKPSKSFLFGDLVDCLITNPAGMEDYCTEGISCSDAVQEIIELAITKIHIDYPDGHEAKQFVLHNVDNAKAYLIGAAREKEWNPKYGDEAIFTNVRKQGGRYYELKAMYPNKIIVGEDIYLQAKRRAEAMEKDPVIGPILRGDGFEKQQQLILEGSYSNTQMKGLMDHVLFDHANKVIYPYDVKTSKTMAQFISNYYSYGYGYQGSWYSDLLKQNYPDYEISEFRFLVVSSTTEETPLVYKMPKSEVQLYAEGGFNRFNNKVIGWHETILDLEWHRRTNNWLYPRSYYQTKEILIDSIYTEAEVTDVL